MEIRQEVWSGIVVVAPVGPLDDRAAAGLDKHLHWLQAEGYRRIVLDLQFVGSMRRSGVDVLVALRERVREAVGQLVLCSAGHAVTDALAEAGVLGIFTLESSRDRAIQIVARA